jgi:hypothetical protein
VPNPRGRPSFSLSVYLVNFSLPLGFCILNGYWLAAFAAPAAITVVWVLATRLLSSGALVQHTPDSLTAIDGALSQRN